MSVLTSTSVTESQPPPAIDRPPPPGPDVAWPEPPQYLLSYIRRPIKRLILAAIDHGWFRLHPLETHVVIAGFPRSGTTLLQAMIETCVADLRAFGHECRAMPTAKHALRNHRFMVTKRIDDVFQIDQLREFYSSRRAKCRFLLVSRDPRSVLTSTHFSKRGYYVQPFQWRWLYKHWRYGCAGDDAVSIRYEDLILHVDRIEQQLSEFIAWEVLRPFRECHRQLRKGFDSRAMHSVRSLDPTSIDRWKDPRHADRIRSLLRDEMPELPDVLIEMGYESNTEWTEAYL